MKYKVVPLRIPSQWQAVVPLKVKFLEHFLRVLLKSLILHPEQIQMKVDGDQTVTYDYSYVPHQKKVMRVSIGKF